MSLGAVIWLWHPQTQAPSSPDACKTVNVLFRKDRPALYKAPLRIPRTFLCVLVSTDYCIHIFGLFSARCATTQISVEILYIIQNQYEFTDEIATEAPASFCGRRGWQFVTYQYSLIEDCLNPRACKQVSEACDAHRHKAPLCVSAGTTRQKPWRLPTVTFTVSTIIIKALSVTLFKFLRRFEAVLLELKSRG